MNRTTYTNTDDLEITTLENAVYMNYKNDISFVFDFELMLYEHQSAYNPDMPLRDLLYVSHVLHNRVKDENLYSKKLIKIPMPQFRTQSGITGYMIFLSETGEMKRALSDPAFREQLYREYGQ